MILLTMQYLENGVFVSVTLCFDDVYDRPVYDLMDARCIQSVARWHGGRVPDLQSIGRGFESQLLHCRVQPWASC